MRYLYILAVYLAAPLISLVMLWRGFFDRSIWELAVGMVVAVIWGAVLISSLIPHPGVSWQGHLSGGIAGVIVAWRLSRVDHQREHRNGRSKHRQDSCEPAIVVIGAHGLRCHEHQEAVSAVLM